MKKICWILCIGGITLILSGFGRLSVQQKPLWIVETSKVLTPAVFADENIFLGTEEGVYCVSAETGAIRWQFSSLPVFTTPVVVKDVLIFATNHPSLYFGLDRHTGKEIWRCETMMNIPGISRMQPVDIVDYVAYLIISTEDEGSKLVGLDSATGKVVWTWPEHAIWEVTPLPGGNRLLGIHTLISIHHEMLYFTGDIVTPEKSGGKHVFALKRTTGQIVWVSELELGQKSSDSFLVDNGTIYTGVTDVATEQPNLAAIDAQTGQTIWRTPVKFPPLPNNFHSLHDHVLLFTDHLWGIFAFDRNTGEELWMFPYYSYPEGLEQIALRFKNLFANPVSLAEENLLVANGYDLYVISPADGTLLSWRRLETLASSRIPPLVANQSIYVGTDEGLARYK